MCMLFVNVQLSLMSMQEIPLIKKMQKKPVDFLGSPCSP